MFGKMTGRQLAGWGYGVFWMGLLCETINTYHSAISVAAWATPAFWIGQAISLLCVLSGISMLMGIRHRPW